MKIQIVILLLLCFAGLTKAFSQTRSNYINFETIDVESGLSQNYVNCVFQDHDGFIWIGTEDGLNRYDGVNFIKYYKDNKIENSISGSRITDIIEDKNNSLWISTKNNGLNKLSFDRKIFTTYFNDSQQSNYVPKISNLEYDGNNKIWFTSNNKIFSFDIRSEKLQNIDLDVDSNFVISDFIIDGENDVWISSNKNFFFRYDVEKNKISNPYSLSDSVSITTIYKFENKIIIGAFENDIFIYDTGKDKCESIFKSVVLNDNKNFLYGKDISKFAFAAVDICADNENKILISGRESLVSLIFFSDISGDEKLATVYYEFDFAGNSIIRDKSGNIWLGTNGKGVRIFNEKFKKFKANYNFDNFESLSNVRSIRAISENSDYLFVSGYYGLIFINKNNYKITNFITEVRKNNPNVFYNPKGIQFDPSIYCILPDPDKPDEIIWIGVEDYCSGLYKYNLNTKKINHFVMDENPDDLTANFVFDICDDRYGNLWLANDYGAYKFNKNTGEFTYFQNNPDAPNSIQSGKITTIYKDSKNVLWFGSENDGISHYEESTGNFIHLREHKNDTNAIQSNGIISIYQDKKQNYWFGSSGEGLTKYDFENNRFVNYTVSDGLPNNVIYGILEDDNGCLWLSTNNGISKFNTATEEFTNFSVSDGLLNIEYNTAAYYKSKDGTMFFGGLNGFDYFKPDEIYTNDYQAPIKITSIKINNIEIQPDSALSSLKILDLSYSDNIFSIEFAALSYFQSAQNEYAYMLEGINSDWVNLGNTNAITFNGLKPGSYILKIKASNNDGLWNEEVLELPIVVHPPLWEESWFVVSIFVVMLIIGAIIFRIRKIQFQKKKNELESIIWDRTFKIQHQNEELEMSVESLEKALDMVNTLSKTKDDMSSMLVHDLKNPLNSIINYSRLIRKSEKEHRPEFLTKTKEIEKSALDMLSLVTNLMDISKMEEAKISLNLLENSLNKAIEEAYRQIKFSLEQKKLTFENRITQSITAEFDYNLIVRVLTNLFTNAVKFSENNNKIIINYEKIDGKIKVKITDYGAGVPQEHQEKIFDKFVQSKVRKLGITQSTGLGLTFSKLVLEAHNQQIGITSKNGEGSTFWFTLKLVSSNAQGNLKQPDANLQDAAWLSNEEIVEMKKQLESLRFFQTGEIFTTLAHSNFTSNEFLEWKKEVEKAVLYTNEAYYNKLIE